ncbi:sugar ABC transporter ATP-binding protein [Amycolatopsis nigrescens]|uniref:sugar ABC transporter ATP-binding protein n=1 Tax=Amycolatopsis nigrescens TaxID=381445 RepID=UPI000368E260|nr:sugar ABC transporter ATP-binding protein [Amycolatopsis nigrescens]
MTISVTLDGLRKSYGGTVVLHDVSLSLRGGEVHGVLGENGAGKSTLIRALCGAIGVDRGRVLLDDEPVELGSPRDALRHKIALISQELALVPTLSVLDNVFLGSWRQRAGWRRPGADRARLAELMAGTGFRLDPDTPVRELPIVAQLQVEVLRALARGARVIAMDEPTALLTAAETERLLELIRRLAADGVAVVLVSHFLEEVLAVCDVVTVLRDGRHVLTAPAAEQTVPGLVGHMVGRPLELVYPEPPEVPRDAPVLLSARGLKRGRTVRDVTVDVRAGEIVGIAGLVGSGRSETLRAIFGADRRDGGEVLVADRPVPAGSPAKAIGAGMAMVPESRKEQGLVLIRSIRENLALSSLGDRQRGGLLRKRAELATTAAIADRLDVRAADTEGPLWTLSGGNQQKVLFGKWLVRTPRVLLVDEPTRGVDVAAKIQIHELLVDLARRGMAVLMVSSEVEEVLGLAHRVLVMRHGRIAGEFARGAASREEVLATAFADAPGPALSGRRE